MEFYLTFSGKIHGRGKAAQKVVYRRHFLKQLQILWRHQSEHLFPNSCSFQLENIKEVGAFRFLPLITYKDYKQVNLQITLLSHTSVTRRERKNVHVRGDIDNHMKLLLDGLRMAQNEVEMGNSKPLKGEEPFLCLLEDDSIINKVEVTHDFGFFLGDKRDNKHNFFALIKVQIMPRYT